MQALDLKHVQDALTELDAAFPFGTTSDKRCAKESMKMLNG